MRIWHGFVLIERPAAITGDEFFDILALLRGVLDHVPDDWNIARQLHWRLALDGSAVIICAAFNREDIDIDDLARLPAYIRQAVPRFTVEQVRQSMRDHIVVFGGMLSTYEESAAAARLHIAASNQFEPEAMI